MPSSPKRTGIIDIGSNSVRLVVYDQLGKVPLQTFNEKTQCALGSGLSESGQLNPEGKERAFRALRRYVTLAQAMRVRGVTALATAAIRMAQDGDDFIAQLKDELGLTVQIISGEQEAELGGLGILASIDHADGTSCDLGGGSAELAMINSKKSLVSKKQSLPLGVLSLRDQCGDDRQAMKSIIDGSLMGAKPLLQGMAGKTLYAIGGSFRALAKLHMEHGGYPLRLVHQYAVPAADYASFCQTIARTDESALLGMPGVTRKRVEMMLPAALMMQRLIKHGQPSQVMMSMYGIREGWILRKQVETNQSFNPLEEVAEELTLYHGGNLTLGEKLYAWTASACHPEPEEWARLRRAACMLVTIPRYELSAERSEAAFYDVLQSPLPALSHGSRFLLALTVMRRYQHSSPIPLPYWHKLGISDMDLTRARFVGMLLNLAYTVSGGDGDVLDCSRILRHNSGTLSIISSPEALIDSEVIQKRLERINQCQIPS